MFKNRRGWRTGLIWALIIVFAFTMVVGCSSNGTPGANGGAADKGTIEVGYVNWAECVAVSNLWKVILEDQGYKVNLKQLDTAPLFVGLSKGDIDLFMDAWLPITHEAYWEEHKDNLEDYGIWYEEPARIGLVVPSYVTIDSIEQMAAEADKFKSEIVGIDPGAGIMKATARANEVYELGFNVLQSSEPAMLAALDKAYGKKEWIAVTGWSPHWKFAKYDLKYLEDPKGAYGEAEELHILANKDFSSKYPEVAEMLKKFTMNDAEIGSLEGLINEGMQPVDAAKKWIEDNQEAVDSWLK
ncbi:MAG: glycine betaine ABC transporter substrate-binding protein [Peptococcaceae bacterium]|nr:glycine betaine ABC transporter substrate-binding protein [Peptococcaceae bacterium]